MGRTAHVFDLIVIGAGTAGLSALYEAKKISSNVLLVQDGPEGTTCVLTGCMPSKTFLHSANLSHSRHKMPAAGIDGGNQLSPDIPHILAHVREVRDIYVESVLQNMLPHRKNILTGKITFETPQKLRVGGRLLHTKNTIIATGARPVIPSEYKALNDRLITTDSFFDLKDIPRRIGVIGLGAVGIELAQSLARLGLEVTAVHKNNCIGDIDDEIMCGHIEALLRGEMRLWKNTRAEAKRVESGIALSGNGEAAEVDLLLVCAGRKPNLEALGLEEIGVPHDENGIPQFDTETGKIEGLPIYLAGDVNKERAVLHEAAEEGRRAAYHALTGGETLNPRKVPLQIIFMQPNIALVGEHAPGKHEGVVTGMASYAHQGRATLEQENNGIILLHADRHTEQLIGAGLVAPEGEHMAHLLALAIDRRLTVRQILNMPFYHPTFEEVIRKALAQILKKVEEKLAA